MLDDYKKKMKETETAFLAATILTNILILLVLCGAFWMTYRIVTQTDSFVFYMTRNG